MNLIESLILLAPSVALLLTLARKLDDSDWLFPSISWQNDRDFFP
jgi:hypothetical protein